MPIYHDDSEVGNIYNEYTDMYMTLRCKLVQYANKIVHQYETAEDIVQECWLHLWTKQDLLISIPKPLRELYVRRCVRNACFDYLRSIDKLHIINIEYIDLLSSLSLQIDYCNSFEQCDSSISITELFGLISTLPEQEKKVVEKKIEGYSTADISEYMHISTGTVRSYWSRARHRLHIIMKSECP